MSADELRQAAATLRERADHATPGPWHVDESTHRYSLIEGGHVRYTDPDHDYTTAVVTHGWDRNLPYVAMMHPLVGLAVAATLEQHAEEHSTYDCDWMECAPSNLARLINGSAS